MTEQEYIDVSNLQRLRAILDLVRNLVPLTEHEKQTFWLIRRPVEEWIGSLEPVVLASVRK